MGIAQFTIGLFVLGFAFTFSLLHLLDRLDRRLWHARIERLRVELRQPRHDGHYLKRTALKLGPTAVPLLVEHYSAASAFQNRGATVPMSATSNRVVDVLLEIVGLDAVPNLVAQLNNPCPIVDGLVRRFGRDAIPILRRVYTDQRPDVRKCVVSRFGQIDDEGGVFCLIEASRDQDVYVRLEAVSGLARRLAKAPSFANSALVAFADNLHHENHFIRAKAISGVRQVQNIAPTLICDVIPLLSNLLNDPEAPTRREAVAVLAKTGERALSELIMACRNDDAETRREALYGIARIGHHARESSPVVLENLNQNAPALRSASIHALRAIGAMDDHVVISTLIDRLNHETDFSVAENIAGALANIPQATEALDKYAQFKARKEALDHAYAEREDGGGSGGDDRAFGPSDPCGLGPESHYGGIMGGY